jgi:hypothetical protein
LIITRKNLENKKLNWYRKLKLRNPNKLFQKEKQKREICSMRETNKNDLKKSIKMEEGLRLTGKILGSH